MLGARYSCVPINIHELPSGMQSCYLHQIDLFGSCFKLFWVRTRVLFILGLSLIITEAKLFRVLYLMADKLKDIFVCLFIACLFHFSSTFYFALHKGFFSLIHSLLILQPQVIGETILRLSLCLALSLLPFPFLKHFSFSILIWLY